MNGPGFPRLAALLLAAALSFACGAAATRKAASPADPLPPEGFLQGWKRAAPPRTFEGAGLYGHIDGGAEVFLELGFDRVTVQRYHREESEISLEVYRMTDPTSALGVYLLKCGRETPLQGLGARNTANRWQVLFVKGSAFVTVSNRSGDEAAARDLAAFARHAARNLPEGGEPPRPFRILPEAGRSPGSERVIRGPFTLARVYTLGRGDLLLLRAYGVTAVSADYAAAGGGTYTRIAAVYPDAEAAAAAFENARACLDPGLEVTERKKGFLAFKDYAGKSGRIILEGRRIEIVVNLSPSP